MRGAGLDRPRRGSIPAGATSIRPLLDVSRDDICRRWLLERGQTWIEDETNDDLRNPRNRVRHRVLPELDAGLRRCRPVPIWPGRRSWSGTTVSGSTSWPTRRFGRAGPSRPGLAWSSTPRCSWPSRLPLRAASTPAGDARLGRRARDWPRTRGVRARGPAGRASWSRCSGKPVELRRRKLVLYRQGPSPEGDTLRTRR